jgi:hypothetical protein
MVPIIEKTSEIEVTALSSERSTTSGGEAKYEHDRPKKAPNT